MKDTDLADQFRATARKRDQLYIAGTEPATTPELEEAADRLREADAAVKAATEVKATRGEVLMEAMRHANIAKYRYTDSDGRSWVVRLKRKATVTVKRAGADDDDGGE